MKAPMGLLQNYEVMLLFVLLLLLQQSDFGGDALKISVHNERQGELMADSVPERASLQEKQVIFLEQTYLSPEQLVDNLKEQQVDHIVLQPSPQSSSEELFKWLAAISGAGIDVQLMQGNQ